jgi:hypothetical protein
VISVVLLAVIAAGVSLGHLRELALRYGEARWSATLIPLSVDGMVVAALLAGKMGGRGEWLLWRDSSSSGQPRRECRSRESDDRRSSDRRVAAFRVRRRLPSASKPAPHRST